MSIEVPFVCCTYTNSFGSLEKTAYSSVYIDDYAEAYKAVKLLIEKGLSYELWCAPRQVDN